MVEYASTRLALLCEMAMKEAKQNEAANEHDHGRRHGGKTRNSGEA